jgi:hypothetical protein
MNKTKTKSRITSPSHFFYTMSAEIFSSMYNLPQNNIYNQFYIKLKFVNNGIYQYESERLFMSNYWRFPKFWKIPILGHGNNDSSKRWNDCCTITNENDRLSVIKDWIRDIINHKYTFVLLFILHILSVCSKPNQDNWNDWMIKQEHGKTVSSLSLDLLSKHLIFIFLK